MSDPTLAVLIAAVVTAVAVLSWLALGARRRRARVEDGPGRPHTRAPDPAQVEPPGPLDENVQFTVYRPAALEAGRWHTLLAFAHLSERRADAPVHEPDPIAEVTRQADAVLKDRAHFRQHTEDSLQAVPQDGTLTFVPVAEGVEFNPPSRTFDWTETVHREEFRMRAAPDLAGRRVRGRMTVYLGSIVLAEIGMALPVETAPESAVEPAVDHARAYRKVFASYSHRDRAIVEEFSAYALAMGDRYLRDVIDLRSGEQWQPALEAMIREADVFQLFWSWHAIESPYVRQEWVYALSLGRQSFVRPVYWQEPLPARGEIPPAALRALHFERIRPRGELPPRASRRPPAAVRPPVTEAPVGPTAPASLPPPASESPDRPSRQWLSALAAAALVAIALPTAYIHLGGRGDGQPTVAVTPPPSPEVSGAPAARALALVDDADRAWRAGRRDEALAELERALVLDPEAPAGQALLARIEADVAATLAAAHTEARGARVPVRRPGALAAAEGDERSAVAARSAGRPVDAVRHQLSAAARLESAVRDMRRPVRPDPP